jgi:hypothetical protein
MKNKVVNFLKPFLISVAESKEMKQLVVELLQKYAKSTSNNVDDLIAKAVEDAIFTPQQPQK